MTKNSHWQYNFTLLLCWQHSETLNDIEGYEEDPKRESLKEIFFFVVWKDHLPYTLDISIGVQSPSHYLLQWKVTDLQPILCWLTICLDRSFIFRHTSFIPQLHHSWQCWSMVVTEVLYSTSFSYSSDDVSLIHHMPFIFNSLFYIFWQ